MSDQARTVKESLETLLLHQEARRNFEWLEGNAYPGRVIIVGLDSSGENMVQVYAIMGRSENSRNRVFSLSFDGRRLFTEPADPSKVQDKSLIIYNAMDEVISKERDALFIVSNGDQTNTAVDLFGNAAWESLSTVLTARKYEPDDPNFTQRITALCRVQGGYPIIELSIIRKSRWTIGCDRIHYQYDAMGEGLGVCITTYAGDGKPLPAFRSEPLLMPLSGDIDHVLLKYWDALNPDNRVSLAVKFISIATGVSTTRIKNKYEKKV